VSIDFDRLKYSLTGEYEEVMLEKQIEEKDKEIERLNNIIKEVREYIKQNEKEYGSLEDNEKIILEILDKVGDEK